MNSSTLFSSSLLLLMVLSFVADLSSAATPRMLALVKPKPLILKYRKGQLLKGNVAVNLIWYGTFTPAQKTIILDFLNSFKKPTSPAPTVASWWSTTATYKGGPSNIAVGKQISVHYSLGKSLTDAHLVQLAAKAGFKHNSINLVLTAADVAVEDFCMSTCASHGSVRGRHANRYAYAWVGNPATQCPGLCAWPFHAPLVGPKTAPLKAPNGDVGIDGMVINIATVLAGTVTNPFDKGYFQGPPSAPLEAVTACTGIFGSGAYPGYPGKVLVDRKSGASYNAQGANGRKYLLPAMWDPTTSKCKPLV